MLGPLAMKNKWENGLLSELGYWKWTMKQPCYGEMKDRDSKNKPLDSFVRSLCPQNTKEKIKILDVGCGPLSPLGLVSDIQIQIIGVDPLADRYKEMLIKHSVNTNSELFPVQGKAESLVLLFGNNMFDVTVSFNSLDHMADPLVAIRQMTRVTKHGGVIYVWCYENEGLFEDYKGLHQWNVELKDNHVFVWRENYRKSLDEIVNGFAEIKKTWKSKKHNKDIVHFILTIDKKEIV